MKTTKIESNLEMVKEELKKKITKMGVGTFSEKVGILEADVSAWLHEKRKWSYEKIIKLAKKLEV